MFCCAQSSPSSEVFSDGTGIFSDISVLERQKAMLQRLYFNQQELSPQSNQSVIMPLFQQPNLLDSERIHHSLNDISPSLGFESSRIANPADIDRHQHRSFSTDSPKDHQRLASTKKRKSEVIDTEGESKHKRREGEAGEAESGLTVKIETENSGKTSKANSKASNSTPKTDYIHVRARRGQATDSHSLAERARREKITKKMKCLQELVPGCNKVTGKAGMLDEIINYVQSLQKQVEFLSMKLATLNPRMDFNMDNLFAKELPAYVASFPSSATPMELMNSNFHQYNQYNQVPQLPVIDLATSANQIMPQRAGASSVSYPETYVDSTSSLQQVQQSSTWESDWQSIYNVSFH